jgi:hypothetical protein
VASKQRDKVPAPGVIDAERLGPLSRAQTVAWALDWAVNTLRDPHADATGAAAFVDRCFRQVHKAERAFPWLSFVRCVDHASRQARANQAFPDARRAKIAREYFARTFADLEAKLDDAKVTAAITAWDAQSGHWKALRLAILDFIPDAPTERSMSRMWQDFPHMQPRKATRQSP